MNKVDVQEIKQVNLTNQENNDKNTKSQVKSSTQERINKRNARVTRIPLKEQSIFRNPDMDPNYYYRYVNDTGNRVEKFEKAGYEKVENTVENRKITDTRSGIPSQIGKHISQPVGNNVTAYLMRQKREWYEQDQKAKQEAINEKMRRVTNIRNTQTYKKDGHHVE